MIQYLAIDPGDTTGWAGFDECGELVTLGQVSDDEFNTWISEAISPQMSAVICEDYVIMQHKAMAHSWKPANTSQKIGAIEFVCHRDGINLVKQRNTIKSTGYQWGGLKKPTDKRIEHQYDAFAHGIYYLQKNGIRYPGQGLKLKGV